MGAVQALHVRDILQFWPNISFSDCQGVPEMCHGMCAPSWSHTDPSRPCKLPGTWRGSLPVRPANRSGDSSGIPSILAMPRRHVIATTQIMAQYERSMMATLIELLSRDVKRWQNQYSHPREHGLCDLVYDLYYSRAVGASGAVITSSQLPVVFACVMPGFPNLLTFGLACRTIRIWSSIGLHVVGHGSFGAVLEASLETLGPIVHRKPATFGGPG